MLLTVVKYWYFFRNTSSWHWARCSRCLGWRGRGGRGGERRWRRWREGWYGRRGV